MRTAEYTAETGKIQGYGADLQETYTLRISPEGGISAVPDISQIEITIEESRSMLTLPDNWDDEGAVKVERGTWERAVSIVRACAIANLLEPPKIGACHDGSIDILWRHGAREVLINIPTDPDERAGYYGDTDRERDETIKGRFKQDSQPLWIPIWLTH